jgi:acetyltransferase
LQPMLLKERAAHVRLSRICHGDYDREITLIADRYDVGPNDLRILGASRLSKIHGDNVARLSMLISDCCQGMGIGKELMKRIIEVARGEKLSRIEMVMTPDNHAMHHLCEANGFVFSQTDEGQVKAELEL